MAEQTPSSAAQDAALALLRALVNEAKSLAHDPAMVHVVAGKLHSAIDALEHMITDKPPAKDQPHGQTGR